MSIWQISGHRMVSFIGNFALKFIIFSSAVSGYCSARPNFSKSLLIEAAYSVLRILCL